MSDEPVIVLRDNAKEQIRSLRDAGILFAALALGGAFVPNAWPIALLSAAIPLLFIPAALSLRRRIGHGATLDGRGIALTFHGKPTTFFPWRDYGGYRPSRKGGYEILDRRGEAAMRLSLPQKGSEAALAELDLRVPEGGFPYDRFRPRVASGRTVTKAVVFALLGTAMIGGGLAAGSLSRLAVLAPLGFLVLAGGLVVGTIEAGHLLQRRRGIEAPALLPPSIPEEGPTAERHLTRLDERPVRLQEGCRYRTVDPERRRAELRVKVHSHIVLLRLSLCLPGIALVLMVLKPETWQTALFALILNLVFPLMLIRPLRVSRELLRSVDDSLWVEGGELIAVRPSGSSLRMPLPTASDKQAVGSLKARGATDILRTTNGERYVLDRFRLYEAPNAVD